MKKIMIPFLALAVLLFSCDNEKKMGTCTLQFEHQADGKALVFDELIYTNAAGNDYQVAEVKYFISDVMLTNDEGEVFTIDPQAIYVDTEYPNTLSRSIQLPEGSYTSFSFTFGLDEDLNKSFTFVNPPESNFSWPDVIGGGYHYMQINGRYEDAAGELRPMNFHTGIGQLYYGEEPIIDSIYEFVQNYFTVSLPCDFQIREGESTPVTLQMELQRWFDTPNVYDHNIFGSSIMQNQDAQTLIKANGHNVFRIK